jgi:hypothetical protein
MIETLDTAMPFPYSKKILARARTRSPSRSRGGHGNAVSLPRLIVGKRHGAVSRSGVILIPMLPDLISDVRSFEAFKHLHIEMISSSKRKTLPAIAEKETRPTIPPISEAPAETS